MTGLAGPARLSDQIPRSGAGTADLRSGHFNTTLFRPFFLLGDCLYCTFYVAAAFFLANVVGSSLFI